jgi:hypothetical protein
MPSSATGGPSARPHAPAALSIAAMGVYRFARRAQPGGSQVMPGQESALRRRVALSEPKLPWVLLQASSNARADLLDAFLLERAQEKMAER